MGVRNLNTFPSNGIRWGTLADRPAIYALRHRIFAAELAQHSTNETGQLRDAVDGRNEYLIAERGGHLVGCVSITPPGPGRGHFVFEKYFERERFPFAIDAAVKSSV
jgi:hypothetical protein